jgi:hypothetical protein
LTTLVGPRKTVFCEALAIEAAGLPWPAFSD